MFHDLYLLYKVNEGISLIAAFDIGFQKQAGKKWQNWYAPVCILNYHINQHIDMAMRIEYYNDPFNNIVSLNTPSGFNTYGFSYNFDVNLIKHLKWRNEIRYLKSEKPVYIDNNALSGEDLFFTTSLALFF